MNASKKTEDLFNFSRAIKNNDEKLIFEFIKNGFDLDYYRESITYKCVESNNLNLFKLLLGNGLNIESLDNQRSFLEISIEMDNVEFIKYYFEKFSYKQEEINLIFLIAIKNKSIKSVKYLIDFINIEQQDHMHIAELCASNNGIEVSEFLIQNHFKISTEQSLEIALKQGHLDFIKFLNEKGVNIFQNNDYFIVEAAKYGYLSIVKYLKQEGLDPNSYNGNALKFAIKNNHIDVAKYLYEINVRCVIDKYDFSKECSYGRFQMIKFLIDNFDINMDENSQYYLLSSIRSYDFNTIKLFLDLNKKTINTNELNELISQLNFTELLKEKNSDIFLLIAEFCLTKDKAIKLSSINGNIQVTKKLLEEGASIEIVIEFGNDKIKEWLSTEMKETLEKNLIEKKETKQLKL